MHQAEDRDDHMDLDYSGKYIVGPDGDVVRNDDYEKPADALGPVSPPEPDLIDPFLEPVTVEHEAGAINTGPARRRCGMISFTIALRCSNEACDGRWTGTLPHQAEPEVFAKIMSCPECGAAARKDAKVISFQSATPAKRAQ